MSHTPNNAPGTASASDKKPSLTGVRIRQRKRLQAATSKFEPEAFRDALLLHLALLPSPPTTDDLVAKLVQAGSTLEFLRYYEQLFELLFVGGLLQPGGSYLDDKRAPVYILQDSGAPDAVHDGVKGMIEVLKRVMQRYKYLQRPLEENFLPGLLGYLPKWDKAARDKIAEAVALLVIDCQISVKCLQSLAKEHVVKDNVALSFLTTFIRVYTSRQPMDQFGSTLRRSGLKDILDVFPLQIRDRKHLEEHFKNEKLQVVVDWYAKLALGEVKEETVSEVERLINDDEPINQIIDVLKTQKAEKSGVSEADWCEWLWLGLMKTVDWTARADQIDTFVVGHVNRYAAVLENFCQSAKAQVSLINAIQVYCYSDTRIIKSFSQILKVLYNADVVSDQAIIYWHQKGAKPNGKSHFLKVTEPLVKFLEEESDESDDE